MKPGLVHAEEIEKRELPRKIPGPKSKLLKKAEVDLERRD
jgi:hypothetical protein